MIRGAFILAMGFVCGYAKAMSEQEAVQDAVTNLGNNLKDLVDEIRSSDSEMTGEDTPGPEQQDEVDPPQYPADSADADDHTQGENQ